jgi:exodeoxyribonuclease V beta subunit
VNLTPFDLRTASLARGTVLLEASAGTGKTYTLVGVLLRMLLEGVVERLDQVLVVTFTVAATEELKTRLRTALRRTLRAADGAPESDPFFVAMAAMPNAKARVRAAIDDFDQVVIATIHGFCKRVLEEAAFESHEPFELEFTTDPVPLLYRAAADVLRTTYEPAVTSRSMLLHAKKVQPKTLVEAYQLWQRHALLPMSPAAPDPAGTLATLPDLAAAAVALWDEDAQHRLENMEWRKENLFGDANALGLADFVERVRLRPHLVWHQLLEFASEVMLEDHVAKSSRANLEHPFFTACAQFAAAADAAFPHVRADLLLHMHERVAVQKQQIGTSSFDDLLVRTHRALHDKDHGGELAAVLQQRYRVALIDEFQDTDALQYEIFATAFAAGTMFLIGDPKQSIYRFRGADLHTYKRARDAANRRHTLAQNHRSSPQLVDAVSALFARPHAFADVDITMPAVRAAAAPGELLVAGDGDPVLRWRFVAGETPATWIPRDEAEERITADLAAEIARLLRSDARLDGRPLRPNDFAVLTRSNRQAVLVQSTLRDAGIPSAIGKAGDVFETDELAELQLFLRAVLQPGDLMRVRGALATRFVGHDLATLRAIDGDDEQFDREIARLDRWRRAWLRSGFVPMIEQAMHELGVVRRFLAMPGGERRLTNFRQLFELLHDAEHAARLSPEGLFEWLQHEQKHKDDLDYTLRELRLESDGDAVQILTVHGSKGLQYEVVFCPFLWEGRDPSGADIVPGDDGTERLVFDLNQDPAGKGRAQAERLAEDLRLAYVALTRAKRRGYVHWGPIGYKNPIANHSPLAWLLTPKPRTPGCGPNGAAAVDWVKGTAEHFKKVESPHWLADLTQRCAASNGLMSVELVPEAPEPQRLPTAAPTAPLAPPRHARKKRSARGLHSFTSITAGAMPVEPLADVVDPAATTLPPARATGIFGFARGAQAGQCLHAILEHVDWTALADGNALGDRTALGDDATRQLVQTTLSAHDLAVAGAHPGDLDPVATVQQNLHDLARALVHADGPTLAALCRGPRVAEWEFVLPMPTAGMQALADCLAARDDAFVQQQATRLRQLGHDTLRGFLTGFVDLVAEHDGRYWVLDWKSNHLGDTLADYGPAALQGAMVHHDYVLQYHLYVLALHRHLRDRRRDYDPERHLGGVCYAFLRGAAPTQTTGMFHDRVPTATVLALDAWLTGGPR